MVALNPCLQSINGRPGIEAAGSSYFAASPGSPSVMARGRLPKGLALTPVFVPTGCTDRQPLACVQSVPDGDPPARAHIELTIAAAGGLSPPC